MFAFTYRCLLTFCFNSLLRTCCEFARLGIVLVTRNVLSLTSLRSVSGYMSRLVFCLRQNYNSVADYKSSRMDVGCRMSPTATSGVVIDRAPSVGY